MSKRLWLQRPNPNPRSHCCSSEAFSFWTVDGSQSHLTRQTHLYSKNLPWVIFTSSLGCWKKTNRAITASSSNLSSLPFSSHFLGSTAELKSFLNIHTSQGCSCRHSRALILLNLECTTTQGSPPHHPVPDCRSPEIPLPGSSTVSSSRARRSSLPAQAPRKNMELFEAEGLSVLEQALQHIVLPMKTLTSDFSCPKWVQASSYLPLFFTLLLFTGPHSLWWKSLS